MTFGDGTGLDPKVTESAGMMKEFCSQLISKYVKTCDRCQKCKHHKQKYGKLPSKIAETSPWKSVCVTLIGPYTLKARDETIFDFMCLPMIDPATGQFETVELPNTECTYACDNKEEIIEVVIDKS